MSNINPAFINMLYRIPVLLLSFMTHELSHALAAYRCGDNTAKQAGRISFNPLRHIDPIGAIMLIVAGFGWAKPVPINPNNFRRRKSGIIVTSLAGPLSNILLAIIFYAIYCVFYIRTYRSTLLPATGAADVMLTLLEQFYVVNISLAAFNLIPIPPLDGSKVLFSLLPDHIYYNYILRYERYGMFVLMALSFSGYLMIILKPIFIVLYGFLSKFVQPIAIMLA